ncbi:MAG: hypothetical protein AAF206_17455 [Bacteroidota bacterium]
MKKSILFLSFFSMVFFYSCQDTNPLEEEPIVVGEKKGPSLVFQPGPIKQSICDQYIGGPQDGPTSGCSSSPCTGVIHLTVSNLNCQENDCYFVFRKRELDYGQPGVTTTNYPCAYNSANEVCIDSEGTYTFTVDLNAGVAAGGTPNNSYYISGLLGYWPNNQNNSVTLSWSGAANGSQTISSGMNFPSSIIPIGACN